MKDDLQANDVSEPSYRPISMKGENDVKLWFDRIKDRMLICFTLIPMSDEAPSLEYQAVRETCMDHGSDGVAGRLHDSDCPDASDYAFDVPAERFRDCYVALKKYEQLE